MIGDASISFVGNISQAPELRYTPAGQAVCNLSVAVQGRRKNAAGGYEDGPTSFYRLTVWRELGEHVAESLNVGDRVVVLGELAVRVYDKPNDGGKGTSVEVEVSEIGPSLRFATTTVKRVPRASSPAPAATGALEPVGASA